MPAESIHRVKELTSSPTFLAVKVFCCCCSLSIHVDFYTFKVFPLRVYLKMESLRGEGKKPS